MAASPAQALGLLKDFPGRSPRVVLYLTLLFAANSSVATVIQLLRLFHAGKPFWVLDFPSFFMAADSVFNHGLSPYAEATRTLYQEGLGFPVLPFLYPPYALPVLYPLSLFDYATGVVIALILNTVAAAVLFRLLHQMFLVVIRHPLAYWSTLLVLLICSSVQESVFVGQVNLAAVLALLLAWQLLRSGARPVLAGMLIGIAIVTKTYFVLLLLMFLPRFEWRPVLGAGITVLAFTASAVVLLPVSLWWEWLVDVAPTGRYGTTPFAHMPSLFVANQSINGTFSRIVGAGETAGILSLAVAGGIVTIVGILLWGRRKALAVSYFDTAIPLLLVTIYLVAPLSWINHVVFVLPALLRLWADIADRGSSNEIAVIGAVGLWVAIPWPLSDLSSISSYLVLIPVPGMVALWVLWSHRAMMSRWTPLTKISQADALR